MKGMVVGAEIGGTKLQIAVGVPGEDPAAVRRGRARPESGAAGILAWFEREIPVLLEEAAAHGQPNAIGVGFGGPVESATGRVLVSHQVSGWANVPLKNWFEERFDLPTAVANDSNAAGWAEYCLGSGRGTRHFFYMNIGSGIGGAMVIDGRLHDGQGFGAAEVGHTRVPGWGRPGDPVEDRLERLCSGWAIERRIRALPGLEPDSPLAVLCEADPVRLTCAMLGEAASQGDRFALAEIDRVAQRVGMAIANVVTLFHPERVALGGGVPLMGDVLLGPIRRYADEFVFGAFRGHYEIVPCALGETVVLAGAMLLAPGV